MTKSTRRDFVKLLAAGALGIGIGAAARNFYCSQTQPTETITKTETAQYPSTTQTSASTTTYGLLRSAAEARGLLIGAAAFPEGFSGFRESLDLYTYTSTLAREFNYLTPENDMKWPYIHPTSMHPTDWWYFREADKIVSFASDHQMKVNGGPLIWPVDQYGLPSGEMNRMREMSTSEFRQLVHEHISTLVGHYKGKIHDWNVVGEAVDDQKGLRKSLFLEKSGEGYIGEAFRVAHEADPDALLIYNDYGAEGLGGKSDRVYKLMKKLVSDGVPVHQVGLQMHLSAWDYPKPEDIATNVRRLAELGLKVNISEMDVQIRELPGGTPERLEVQRKVYHDVIAACLKETNFTDITFWGFTDKYSWIDYFFGPDDPLLFDSKYNPKPAYWGVLTALLDE